MDDFRAVIPAALKVIFKDSEFEIKLLHPKHYKEMTGISNTL